MGVCLIFDIVDSFSVHFGTEFSPSLPVTVRVFLLDIMFLQLTFPFAMRKKVPHSLGEEVGDEIFTYHGSGQRS